VHRHLAHRVSLGDAPRREHRVEPRPQPTESWTHLQLPSHAHEGAASRYPLRSSSLNVTATVRMNFSGLPLRTTGE
jgi:hypothetical protein